MMASRGMGAIRASKMPKGTEKARRDDTDFTEFKEGGKVKSKVNAAGITNFFTHYFFAEFSHINRLFSD